MKELVLSLTDHVVSKQQPAKPALLKISKEVDPQAKGIRISLYTVFEIFVSASSPLSPIIFFNFNILQGSFSNSPRQRPKLKSGRTETKQKICLPIFWLLARKLSQTKNLQMFKSLIPPLLPLLPPDENVSSQNILSKTAVQTSWKSTKNNGENLLWNVCLIKFLYCWFFDENLMYYSWS